MSTDEGVHLEKVSDPATPPAGSGVEVVVPGRRRGARRKPREGVDDAAVVAEPAVDPGTDLGTDPSTDPGTDPRFWHRAHPVFTPLAGFFTGVGVILVVLGALGWLLDEVFQLDFTEHPWIFLAAIGAVFLVNLGLVARPQTRRFARYMLFGVLATPLVVAGVAALTTWVLISSDG